MEISLVRQRVIAAIDRAKRAAADRRTHNERAVRSFESFLSGVAIPLFHQIAGVLRAEGHPFSVFTPAGSVRLASDRSADDYIELLLDTGGASPQVLGHVRRSRGRRVVESETAIEPGVGIPELTEQNVLAFVLKELEPFVER